MCCKSNDATCCNVLQGGAAKGMLQPPLFIYKGGVAAAIPFAPALQQKAIRILRSEQEEGHEK